MRRLRAAILGFWALSGTACEPLPEPGPIEQEASALLGVTISGVESTEGWVRTVEDCVGRDALVVPPDGVVYLPVRRGFHTLSGKAALCDGHGPGRFSAVLRGERPQELLAFEIDSQRARRRRGEPFVVTFWSERDAVLGLLTTRGPDEARHAWLELALDSRLAPPAGVAAELEARARFVDTTPGRRARRAAERNLRGRIWLSDFGWAASSSGWGPIEIDRNNGSEAAADGSPISIAGRRYDKGIGMHPPGMIVVELGGKCRRFASDVGVDDAAEGAGSVEFSLYGDEQLLWRSPIQRAGQPPARADVDLTGKRWLRLEVSDAGDGPEHDWADWADAELGCSGDE